MTIVNTPYDTLVKHISTVEAVGTLINSGSTSDYLIAHAHGSSLSGSFLCGWTVTEMPEGTS